jgi:hypothetical protein
LSDFEIPKTLVVICAGQIGIAHFCRLLHFWAVSQFELTNLISQFRNLRHLRIMGVGEQRMAYTISGVGKSSRTAMRLTAGTAQGGANAKAQGLQSNGLKVTITGPDGKTMTMKELSDRADAEGI